jgi:hypothetical protein
MPAWLMIWLMSDVGGLKLLDETAAAASATVAVLIPWASETTVSIFDCASGSMAAVASTAAIAAWAASTVSVIATLVAATTAEVKRYQAIAFANDICCSLSDPITSVTVPAAEPAAAPDHVLGANNSDCSCDQDSETDNTCRSTPISASAREPSESSSACGHPPPVVISSEYGPGGFGIAMSIPALLGRRLSWQARRAVRRHRALGLA